MNRLLTVLFLACAGLTACSPSAHLGRTAKSLVNDPALRNAHIGISVYDPATRSYRYNYQGDKFFIPASNTKLATCYAALRHLGDSLPALRYAYESDSVIDIFPTGDPTFLNAAFAWQPVLRFLQGTKATIYLSESHWQDEPLGPGWSWNDYQDAFMSERNAFPVYENVARFSFDTLKKGSAKALQARPSYFSQMGDTQFLRSADFSIARALGSNSFHFEKGTSFRRAEIPFHTNNDSTAAAILRNEWGINIVRLDRERPRSALTLIRSQPTDSMLKRMMHNSNNFLAEQSLLMVSNEMLGVMNGDRAIDSLLRTDLADLPQKPRWADGSGLSRYNLFTPQDMISILDHMRRDFGLDRIKSILPTGNTGTLANYYRNEQGRLWAKTGTLSGVVAISGFAYDKKGKLLIFSVLVNNHQGSAGEVRRAVERFIESML